VPPYRGAPGAPLRHLVGGQLGVARVVGVEGRLGRLHVVLRLVEEGIVLSLGLLLRPLERLEHGRREFRDAQPKVVHHGVEERQVRRLHLADDLLQRLVVQVAAEAELDHEYSKIITRHGTHLQSRERSKENLALAREL